ncbi:uncharacterized protein LOC123655844 [Melitaea cinxia]|uniref:uncharacterized protein LOC123655844 n=1 Tax=Melitaea cinxia TaxID=113334 RepID=UPI001E26EEEF|nr:uncharacterized protein LOC123655844 [Melitaea cinxia]
MSATVGGLCFLLIISAVNMLNLLQNDANTFGPYDVSWTQYNMCKGPKSKNDTVIFTNITNDGGHYIAYYNLTFLDDVKFTDVKIWVYTLTNNRKNLLWTYKITDPCKHFAIASVVFTYLKTNSCFIKKGSYVFSIPFEELTYAFFGSSFFYGDYSLKSLGTSKQGNIMCLTLGMKFSKKRTEKETEISNN